MSLKLKFSMLFAFILAAITGFLFIQLSASSNTASEIEEISDSSLPRQQMADSLLETFERIDNLLQYAVLTAEHILIDNADGDIETFKSGLSALRALQPDNELMIERISQVSNNYFRNARELAIAIINTDEDATEITPTFNELSSRTSDYRDRLRDLLVSQATSQKEQLSRSLVHIVNEAQRRLQLSFVLGILMTLSLAVVLISFTRAIVIPVAELSRTAGHVAMGNYDSAAEVAIRSKDEIGKLAQSFREMSDTLQETTVSRDFFDKIINSMGDMLILTDDKNNIVFFNRAVQEELGIMQPEVEGKNLNTLLRIDGKNRHLIQQEYEARFEAEIVSGKGTIVPVAVSKSKIYLDGGKEIRHVFVASNISAQKRAEAAERLAKETAIERQQLQEDRMMSIAILVSGVAHEINNPNHMILSNISFIRKAWESAIPVLEKVAEDEGEFNLGGIPMGRASELVPQAISIIKGGSERIKTIVKELRDYSREQPLDRNETVDINSIIKSASTLLHNMITKSTDCFETRLTEENALIRGNYQRIEQVVINLLANACQALTSKEQCIEVTTAKSAGTVQLIVRDQGMGIEKQTLKRVFDPFFTTKRGAGGTGLGLSISKRIIEEHQGTISIETAKAEGTSILISLPAITGEKEER